MLRRVAVGEIELQVCDEGSGPVLLLVHGFPLDHTMWREQIDALSDANRVVAFDLRGFGGSSPAGSSLTLEMLADDCANLLDALEISERVVFCGLSMGGYIAWQFWARHARRLRGLILCDTRAGSDSSDAARARRDSAVRVMDEGSDFLIAAMLPKLLSRETSDEQPELVVDVRSMMIRTSCTTLAAALCAMAARGDMTMRLPDVKVPTLLLGGEFDAISPPDEMRMIAAEMPDAQFIEIHGAGHLAPLEKPAAVNQAIRGFLTSLP